MRKWLRFIWHLPRHIVALVITGYQHTLSPDHGPLKHLYPYGYCRHEPTCSTYSKQMLLKRGLLIGGLVTLKRVLSCNPFAKPSDEKLKKLAARASQ